MTADTPNRFSAAGSALGYLAQVEYGLLLMLQRMDGNVSLTLSMETADDLELATGGSARELWQTKHHVNRRGSLADLSPDIWKTISNWIETSAGSECFLLSTAAAPENSAAALLSPGRPAGAVIQARTRLEAAARRSSNKSLQPYFERFLALEPEERAELVGRITVLDQASSAADLTEHLIGTVRKTVTNSRRLPLIERLRGWWHERVLTHLNLIANGQPDRIDMEEVEGRLLYFARSLQDDTLPLDFDDSVEPTLEEIHKDDRVFVRQLRLILLHHSRIRLAVKDHHRAFSQRSRWQREQLLGLSELERYDRRLRDEWQRVFLPLEEGSDDTSEDERRRRSRELFSRLEQSDLPELREGLRSGWVPIGSLHILADRLEIGWHPDWLKLLRETIVEAEDGISAAVAAS